LTTDKNIYDFVIVGGGIMGSSTADHLMQADQSLKIAVIEPDPTYERTSSTLSLANVRIQYSLKENVHRCSACFKTGLINVRIK